MRDESMRSECSSIISCVLHPLCISDEFLPAAYLVRGRPTVYKRMHTSTNPFLWWKTVSRKPRDASCVHSRCMPLNAIPFRTSRNGEGKRSMRDCVLVPNVEIADSSTTPVITENVARCAFDQPPWKTMAHSKARTVHYFVLDDRPQMTFCLVACCGCSKEDNNDVKRRWSRVSALLGTSCSVGPLLVGRPASQRVLSISSPKAPANRNISTLKIQPQGPETKYEAPRRGLANPQSSRA